MPIRVTTEYTTAAVAIRAGCCGHSDTSSIHVNANSATAAGQTPSRSG